MPREVIAVSESGLKSSDDLLRLKRWVQRVPDR